MSSVHDVSTAGCGAWAAEQWAAQQGNLASPPLYFPLVCPPAPDCFISLERCVSCDCDVETMQCKATQWNTVHILQ